MLTWTKDLKTFLTYSQLTVEPFCAWTNSDPKYRWIHTNTGAAYWNEELEPMFELGYHKFWLQNQMTILYLALWFIVQKLLNAFPSSYVVEQRFSDVMNLIIKKQKPTRNWCSWGFAGATKKHWVGHKYTHKITSRSSKLLIVFNFILNKSYTI